MIARFSLSGLKCKGCMEKVRKKVEEAGAVVRGISLKELEIEIPDGESVGKFVEVIRCAGYDAKLIECQ
jgi:copper chaperone CopZ